MSVYLQDGLNDAQSLQQSGQRSAMKKIIYTVLLGWIATNSWASEQVCCVFDPVGTQGDISRRFQDIRLYAQQSRVQLKFKTFQISKVSPVKQQENRDSWKQSATTGIGAEGYEALVAKIRNRYVDSGYYDAYFVDLIRWLRCLDDPQCLECRK